MKNQTIKDFILMYNSEDEEKLVLIQSGIGASQLFMQNYWTANTYALAMADAQGGHVVSNRCYLNWPITDQEKEAGEYSKRFTEGKVYRIKARCWNGAKLNVPKWYVTEVLEEGVHCQALEQIWAEYIKPVILEDEALGVLTLDRKTSVFNGSCQWMGKDVGISLDIDIESKASWTRAGNVMKQLLADREKWDKSLRTLAAQKLTVVANEWLSDDDRTHRDPEKEPITEVEFASRISLVQFSVSPGGRFTAWYEDDGMFWGHMVTVDGSLKKGPIAAEIQG